MSWGLKERQRSRLAGEEGPVIKDWGGKTSVALVYPNIYRVGMGNLAIHSLYKTFNDRPEFVCERVFLPDKTEFEEYRRTDSKICSIETQRPLGDFDIVAFSISFENDYLNILPILSLAGIPHRAEERSAKNPILIAGGAAPTLNPMPVSKIFDAVVMGEAEALEGDLLPIIGSRAEKSEILMALREIAGVFVPLFSKIGPNPERRHLDDLDAWRTETAIWCSDAEFSNMHLIEVERGCPYRCNFCATPVIYGTPRKRSAGAIVRMAEDGSKHRKKIGLIGTYILSHPEFTEIARSIHSMGAAFSPSSIRADEIDEKRAMLLYESGHRSVALGVEAGSEALRKTLGKNISSEQIIDAASILASCNITRLKLYFMIGLPGETEGDLSSIADISGRVHAAIQRHAPRISRQTSVDLTFSPFIPKPGTAFENAEFAGEASIRKKIAFLKKISGRSRVLNLRFDSPREALLEHTLSNGGGDIIEFLEKECPLG